MGSIYLIRHGQASLGAANYDVLSPLGIRQSQLCGEHFGALGLQFDACYAGTLQRQIDTARHALDAMNQPSLAVQSDASFNEYHSDQVLESYLPQVLDARELTGGNGMVEMGTFVAILLGQVAGGLLVAVPQIGHLSVAIACVAVALIGRAVAQAIPPAPATDPGLVVNWNPVSETWRNLQLAHENIVVFRSLLGISWMWFFGAVFLSQFPSFAKEVLHGNEQVASLLLVVEDADSPTPNPLVHAIVVSLPPGDTRLVELREALAKIETAYTENNDDGDLGMALAHAYTVLADAGEHDAALTLAAARRRDHRRPGGRAERGGRCDVGARNAAERQP